MLIHELFGIRKQEPPESNAFDCSTMFGIEVELEEYDGERENTDYWNVIHDGSLRNDGVEFVFNSPLGGDDIRAAMEELEDMLRGHHAATTHRTSVHFHVDFSGDDMGTVEKFYILCMLFEPSLYTMGSKARYSNIYCPGLTHATQQIRDAAIGFMDETAFTSAVHGWCKYTGINLASLGRFGTVELRNHAGTVEVARISKMVKVLSSLKWLAVNLTLKDIVSAAKPLDLLKLIPSTTVAAEIGTCEALETYWPSVKRNLEYYLLCQEIVVRGTAQFERRSRTEIFDRIEDIFGEM